MRGSSVLLIYLIPLVLIVFLFRNQRRKQRAAQEQRSQAVAGSEVMTTAGLYGTIVEVRDDSSVIIEAAPGVRLRFDQRAIARIFEPVDSSEEDAVSHDGHTAADSTQATDAPTHSSEPGTGADPDEPER